MFASNLHTLAVCLSFKISVVSVTNNLTGFNFHTGTLILRKYSHSARKKGHCENICILAIDVKKIIVGAI